MKKETKQIQSYLPVEQYNELKQMADKEGLLFATLIRQILVKYLAGLK